MQKILKFCLSSFSSFIVDYLIYFIMIHIIPESAAGILISNVTARVISASFNYFINRKFVFETQKSIRSASEYFILALCILILNSFILELFTQKLGINALIAKIITECVVFSLSWIVQSRFIFRKRKEENGNEQ